MEACGTFPSKLFSVHSQQSRLCHSVARSTNLELLAFFTLYLPLRSTNSVSDTTLWFQNGEADIWNRKTRTCRLSCSFAVSWKRKRLVDRQLQQMKTNGFLRQFNCLWCWPFLAVVFMRLARSDSLSIFSSCQTEETPIARKSRTVDSDPLQFSPKQVKRSDHMLSENISPKSFSPRLGRTKMLRPSIVEQAQPFLYRKARHHRMSETEEQECLYILHRYRKLEEKKLKSETSLSRRIGSKEWSSLCHLSVFDLRRWNKAARLAKHKLITSHLQLVNAICRDFLRKGLSYDDLVQEGVVGLLRAMEKFDIYKGVRFSTYASWWIRQSLQRAVNEYQHLIRLPVHISDALKAIRRESWFLSSHLGQLPNTESLSTRTGIPYSKVAYYCKLAILQLPSFSLERKITTPHKVNRRQDPCTFALYDLFLRDDLEQCFSVLQPKERDILCLRYGWKDGEPKTLTEIGRQLELTEEGVRRIERRALNKIRNSEQVETLRHYL